MTKKEPVRYRLTEPARRIDYLDYRISSVDVNKNLSPIDKFFLSVYMAWSRKARVENENGTTHDPHHPPLRSP